MTTTTTTTTTTARRGSRTSAGFVALLLLTAGAMIVAGQWWPVAGDALVVALGIELLVWAAVARDDGPLVAGGVTTGVGVGILAAAGPLLGADPRIVGATFMLSVAAGFLVIAGLSRVWLHRTQWWAVITAAVVGVVGGALLVGSAALAGLLAWGLPAALLLGGIAMTVAWRRGDRR